MTREQKAQAIADIEGAIKFVTSQNTYVVKSQSKKGAYYVTDTEFGGTDNARVLKVEPDTFILLYS